MFDERIIPPKMRKKEVADVVVSGSSISVVLADGTQLTVTPRDGKSLNIDFSYMERKSVPLYIENK